jgi:hypothetical protein
MPPYYEPPYDSPIEDQFAKRYVKYAGDAVVMLPQVQVKTICGTFIVDFVLTAPDGYRVGIECDGKEFHEPSRDEWRDAMILGGNHLDAMYRIRGSDITYHLDDVLYLLSALEPSVFASRAMSSLEVLASPEIQKIDLRQDIDNYQVAYDGQDLVGAIHIEARRQHVPTGQRRFWQAAYQHATSLGGGELDAVIADYRAQSTAKDQVNR